MTVPTGMLVHAYDPNAPDWKQRSWGIPPLRLGRLSRAIQLIHCRYPDAKHIMFGSGKRSLHAQCESERIVSYLIDNFLDLRQFDYFSKLHGRELVRLRSQVARLVLYDTVSHNTATEAEFGIPDLYARGIRRIVILTDTVHAPRCFMHAARVREECALWDLELVLEHSDFRLTNQDRSAIAVFEPETEPEASIQLGSMAKDLFSIKKGSRAEFKKVYDALIKKYST